MIIVILMSSNGEMKMSIIMVMNSNDIMIWRRRRK